MNRLNPMFRVECPVCLNRRPLSEDEKQDFLKYNKYQWFQFCSKTCESRAKPKHKEAVQSTLCTAMADEVLNYEYKKI